jgi:hypothetical protein
MQKLKAFLITNWVLIIGIFAIMPFIMLSFFNYPSSDDFCYSLQSMKLGFWKAQLKTYEGWSGRYFATAILSINPLVFKWIDGYKILSASILVMFMGSIYYFIKTLFSNRISKKEELNISIALIVLYFYQMTRVVAGFYWMTASITYQLGTILSILSFAILLKVLFRVNDENKKVYICFSLLYAIGAIGSNETIMFILFLQLFAVLISNYLITKKLNRYLVFLFLIAAFACFVVYVAPGNIHRFQNDTEVYKNPELRHNFILSLSTSFMTATKYTIEWLTNLTIILFTALYIPYGIKISEGIPKSNSPFSIHPAMSIMIFLTIFVLCFFPSYWGTYHLERRVVNVIYLYFLIGWFFNVQVIIYYLSQKEITIKHFSNPVSVLIAIMIIIKLAAGGNIQIAYKDLISGSAYRYNNEMNARYEKISKCKSEVCEIEKISNRPSTIFWDDITTDEKHWVNLCTGDYFDKTLKLKSP